MKIENAEKHMCDYGCNHIAQYKLANGKYCCSESSNSCEANKQKNGKTKIANKVCPFCNTKFKQVNVRVFANHVRWCSKNPKHNQICGENLSKKIKNAAKIRMIEKFGEFREFTVKCYNPKCDNYLTVVEREKKFPEKEKYFCCDTCTHSFIASNRSLESKQKIRKTLKSKKHIIKCIDCGKDIEVQIRVNKARCNKCREKYEPKYLKNTYYDNNGDKKTFTNRYDHIAELQQFQELVQNKDISNKELFEIRKKVFRIYRVMCGFTFSIRDFPDEFDIELLKLKGMYSAKNHGNNKNGVSRDHMYSCADGFKNNISPLIISHPANCKLITQHDNASKRHKSSITLDELLKRIEIWDQKYGKYEKKNISIVPIELFNKIQDAKICHPMNFDGYALIYEKTTLKMKWWNVKDNPIPDGWQTEMPLELRLKQSHKRI